MYKEVTWYWASVQPKHRPPAAVLERDDECISLHSGGRSDPDGLNEDTLAGVQKSANQFVQSKVKSLKGLSRVAAENVHFQMQY